ncbi:hypothetical protein EV383_3296 [Pseudonocardia sediminis]|uniref:Uncharacterized protein n=1 Tax=Pseudonocardia sediminis TaxID=1397368 RepID=A0A4Q7UZF1_PSEST|nr:hypothetical protein [Pseudonocardia sediminis]RZT86401.1 hypothetical protein EV383_3296 [Pseudonocardia sediminis]
MNTDRWTAVSAVCGVVGGASWLAKVAVILAQQGSGGVDVPLFGAGLGLLLVAATGVGLAASRGRPVWARAVAVVLAPALALGLFVLVQIITEPLGVLVPEYVEAEYGILLAAVVGVLAGVWRLVRPTGSAVRAQF